eukprot:Amastigsp_a842540_113.p2 type:complete len:396 gc:universal Amastigsp_a842540_113:1228-41(-)
MNVGMEHNSALRPRLLHVCRDRVELRLIHERTHVDALVERVSEAERVHAAAQLGEEGLPDVLLEKEARACAAHLAAVRVDGVDDALDGRVKVGRVEDDERRLAAKLERDLLAGACETTAQITADGGGASEGNLIDVGVVRKDRARAARGGDDVDDARRDAGLGADLCKEKRREARVRRGLDDDRVAHRQSRRDFPAENHEREVPGNDACDDTHGLPLLELLGHECSPSGVVVEVPREQRHVEITRLANRLAVVHRLEDCEEAMVLLHVAGNRVEVLGAHVRRESSPRDLRSLGGGNGGNNVGVRAFDCLCENLAGGGAGRRLELGARGNHPLVVDEVAKAPVVLVEPSGETVRLLGRGPIAEFIEDVANGQILLGDRVLGERDLGTERSVRVVRC